MGRPMRDQVVSARPATTTTLQALEFANGRTLSLLLARGAGNLMAAKPKSSTELVTRLYAQAFGRAPTGRELQLCAELLDPAPDTERVEDLLWSLAMLPEFQLIY